MLKSPLLRYLFPLSSVEMLVSFIFFVEVRFSSNLFGRVEDEVFNLRRSEDILNRRQRGTDVTGEADTLSIRHKAYENVSANEEGYF